MSASVYSLRRIEGLATSDRRAVALLECSQDKRVDAGEAFARLSVKKDRELRNRLDYWIQGGVNDEWFHGWASSEPYRDCFVFRWKERRRNHRIYGFLCNPIPSNPRFSVCVLVSHATKSQRRTDPAVLNRIHMLRRDAAVMAAVHEEFQ